jgi:hypothetical protein
MDEVLKKIVFLPHTFNSLMNKSVYDLLKESGYFELYNDISEKAIRIHLEKYPECVNEWMSYSEDKRCSSGYYLQKNEKKYIVGYLDDKTKKQMKKEFTSETEACAVFIRKEIENIRLSG